MKEVVWTAIEETLPDSDRRVLVWVENIPAPNWSKYAIGSFINGTWYLDGGRNSHEVVTQWYDFPNINDKSPN